MKITVYIKEPQILLSALSIMLKLFGLTVYGNYMGCGIDNKALAEFLEEQGLYELEPRHNYLNHRFIVAKDLFNQIDNMINLEGDNKEKLND